MANLQATTVATSLTIDTNTYMKLDKSYFSSGGSLANFAYNAYYNGSWALSPGTALQVDTSAFKFIDVGAGGTTTYLTSTTSLTTVATTSTTFGSGVTNTVGIGAAAGSPTTDGKLLINAGGVGKPIIEVDNCAGNGSTNSAFYSTFKGWLAVKIGTGVGTAAADVGTWYIKLWG
jgi:hypothetical protein